MQIIKNLKTTHGYALKTGKTSIFAESKTGILSIKLERKPKPKMII